MPKVSIIMPCFNHVRFVLEAANIVLRQTEPDLELIIIDDSSSDGSWDTIQGLAQKDPRVQGIRHARNQGASSSRNDGLRAARGEFIGFCDADDVWEPNKLETQLSELRNNPDFAVAYCDTTIIDERGLQTGRRFSDSFRPPKSPSGWLFRELVRRNFINMQSVLMPRECMKRAGFFDAGIKWVEDWWYWVRLSRHYRFLYSPRPLARYRVHALSTNLVQKRNLCANRFKVLNRILHEYPDLPLYAKADVIFNMGAALSDLGKYRTGRHFFWGAIRLSMADFRALITCCRAVRRLILHADSPTATRILQHSER